MMPSRIFTQIALSLAGVLLSTDCIAEPFNYQGQLYVNGLPAAGLYDLEARLFDDITMGEQVGKTVIFEDHPVPSGLLELELEFGDVYNSSDVYLEISVRVGESEDLFDTLSPRQRIVSTPKAIHANTADSILGGGWSDGGEVTGGGRILWHGGGSDRVLINRMTTISPTEFFGVHTKDSPIGGIVISNDDANAVTLLTFAPGGDPKASVSYSGMTSEWAVEIDNAFILTASATGVKASSYAYTEPVASAITIAGDSFHSAFGTPFRASFFGGGAYLSTPGDNAPLIAPVNLPHGATVTKLVVRLEDNTSSDIAVSLQSALADGSLFSLAAVNTMGISPMPGIQTLMTETIDSGAATINGFGTGYYLRVFSSSWPGDSSLRIWSVTIEYTVGAPG